MKTSRNDTKEEHIVPRMLLKRFTCDGEHCFTINNKGNINLQSIKKICKKKNYYEIRNDNGEIVQRNVFEKGFFNPMETACNERFDKLCELIDSSANIKTIQDFDFEEIIVFLTTLVHRNPRIINEMEDVSKEIGIRMDYANKYNISLFSSLLNLIGSWTSFDKDYNIIIHKNSTSVPFVISDVPFVFLKLTQDMSLRLIYFPISSKHMIILEANKIVGKLPCRMCNSAEPFVNYTNYLMCKNLQYGKIIIAENKEVLENLKRYIK